MYDGIYYPSVVEAAERRLRRGERQVYCAECRLWRWPEECAHQGRLMAAQFRRWLKEAAGDAEDRTHLAQPAARGVAGDLQGRGGNDEHQR